MGPGSNLQAKGPSQSWAQVDPKRALDPVSLGRKWALGPSWPGPKWLLGSKWAEARARAQAYLAVFLNRCVWAALSPSGIFTVGIFLI